MVLYAIFRLGDQFIHLLYSWWKPTPPRASMEVVENINHGDLNPEVEAALRSVASRAAVVMTSLLKRVKARASAGASGQQVLTFQQQYAAAESSIWTLRGSLQKIPTAEERKATSAIVTSSLVSCLESYDRVESELEELRLFISAQSREVRRDFVGALRGVETMFVLASRLAQQLSDFLDEIDPSPKSDLEQALVDQYGQEASNVFRAFSRIAHSDEFTLDAFKKRIDSGS